MPQLIRRIKPAVVAIITYDSGGEKIAQGSGFFIAPNRIITNRHVIEDAYSVEVKTYNGNSFLVEGVISADEEGDLVMLQVSIPATIKISPLEIELSKPEEGERVLVIGNPLGLEGTISDGLVSAVREVANFGTIIQITAPVSPGSSGSPVINLRGQVVGIATLQLSKGENLNFAMPSARITAMHPTRLKTLTEFATETVAKKLAQARRLVFQGKTMIWATMKKQPDGSLKIEPDEYKKAHEKAIPLFIQATRLAPDFADAWSELGSAYSTLDKYREAVEVYKQAIRLNPNDWPTLFNLATAYDELKEYRAALGALQKVIRLRSDFYSAYGLMASVYLFGLDNNRAAIQASLQAIHIKPDYDYGHYYLGMAYLFSGNRNAALKEYKILKPLNAKLADELFKVIYDR